MYLKNTVCSFGINKPAGVECYILFSRQVMLPMATLIENLHRVRAQHVSALLSTLSLHYRVTESYYMALLGILIGFSHKDFFQPSELQSYHCEYKITQCTLADDAPRERMLLLKMSNCLHWAFSFCCFK